MRLVKAILKDDLFFHSVHGLCRVEAVTQQTKSKETSYALVPVPSKRAKTQYIIPESSLAESGFSKLITLKNAKAILKYFETGEKKGSGDHPAWEAAELVMAESQNKSTVRDARKRQMLERSVKGLVGEIAYVFNTTLQETSNRIRKSLGSIPNINPLVLNALAHAGEE